MLNSIFKINFLICVFILVIFYGAQDTLAVVDPRSFPNNKFGIHITDEHDLAKAAELVNSNGGDWGYVTIVIRKDQIHQKRWQEVFDSMRRLHLIPLVRIATTQESGYWSKPRMEDIDTWVSFLNSLNWVTKNRYIIVGNEVNHTGEWGGELDPSGYAEYLIAFSTKLKSSNTDYFVLPAGFDASAPNGNDFMDEEDFIAEMLNSHPNIFDHIDGWNSHSYPNPGFAGSVDDVGRGSIRSYQWELSILLEHGITKDFPIFITETGWIRGDHISEDVIAENFTKAFQTVWNDSHIVAVTPFILNYKAPPFEQFSWITSDGSHSVFFDRIKSLSKLSGIPLQENEGDLSAILVPPVIDITDTKIGIAMAKNTGQAIWHKDETNYIQKDTEVIEITTPIFSDIVPEHSGLVYFRTYDSPNSNQDLALKLKKIFEFSLL